MRTEISTYRTQKLTHIAQDKEHASHTKMSGHCIQKRPWIQNRRPSQGRRWRGGGQSEVVIKSVEVPKTAVSVRRGGSSISGDPRTSTVHLSRRHPASRLCHPSPPVLPASCAVY